MYLEKGKKAGVRTGVATRGKTEIRNEDAYYTTNSTLGVADGVSAWRSLGIDAGVYARELLHHCESLDAALISTMPADSPHHLPLLTLPSLLHTAWTRTHSLGSCTVLLAHLSSPTQLTFLSLGDSRGIVVRLIDSVPRVVFRTTTQTHDFNVPYQLAHAPRASAASEPFIEDSVTDAVVSRTETHPGDLVVIGTDGLWDNLFEEEIVEIIRRGGSEKDMAEDITANAVRKAGSMEKTPFGERRRGGSRGVGGKPDDITTVVARIIEMKT